MHHRTGLLFAAIVFSSVIGGCKSDKPDSPAAPPSGRAPSSTTPGSSGTASVTNPPSADTADCRSTADFKSVEHCVELCKQAYEQPCYVAGASYWAGTKTEKDASKAIKYFSLGCQMKSGVACKRLGTMQGAGEGMLKANTDTAAVTYAHARGLLQKECEAKQAGSCSELAAMFEGGWGGVVDKATAASFRKQACDLGSKTDCV